MADVAVANSSSSAVDLASMYTIGTKKDEKKLLLVVPRSSVAWFLAFSWLRTSTVWTFISTQISLHLDGALWSGVQKSCVLALRSYSWTA